MSNFEIFLIVAVFAIPVIALLFVVPKMKKKEKKKDVPTAKSYTEMKQEEKNAEPIDEKPTEKKENLHEDIPTEDIQSYVEYKKKNITKPSRIEMPQGFVDRTMPYTRKRNTEKKPQTVAEEIQNLSPELKALIIAGVLDKKF